VQCSGLSLAWAGGFLQFFAGPLENPLSAINQHCIVHTAYLSSLWVGSSSALEQTGGVPTEYGKWDSHLALAHFSFLRHSFIGGGSLHHQPLKSHTERRKVSQAFHSIIEIEIKLLCRPIYISCYLLLLLIHTYTDYIVEGRRVHRVK
jgi:hypothetical protein